MPTYFEKQDAWLIPKDDAHFETLTASVVGTRKWFQAFAEKEAERFCRSVRKTLADSTRGKPEMPKTEVCRKFKLAARVANMTRKVAMAMASSAEECLQLNKAELDDKIKEAKKELAKLEDDLAGKEWMWKTRRDVSPKKAASKQDSMRKLRLRIDGKKKHIARLQRRREKLPDKPSVFAFGKKAYCSQPGQGGTQKERDAWRRGFREARNCMFGAPGSSDEAGGNSTYRITYSRDLVKCRKHLGRPQAYVVVEFKVWVKGKMAGKFYLRERTGRELQAIIEKNGEKFAREKVVSETAKNPDGTPKVVPRKVRTGRVALKVFFMRKGNAWNIYISYPLTAKPQNVSVKGAIGVDTNHGHFDSYEVSKDGFIFGQYHRNAYDIDGASAKKRHAIAAHIRKLVFRAWELGYAIVLENLDFEYAKSTLRNKLGATLHTMPYKAIAAKFRRECLRMGVPIRFIAPSYTSLLGNILSTLNCRLSRDVAAAGTIALMGLEDGGQHLLSLVEQVELSGEPGSFLLRLNEKNKCGRHVKVVGINLRQSDSKVSQPTGAQAPLKHVGAVIQQIARAAGSIRRAGRILCQASRDNGKATSRRGAEPRRQSQKQVILASRCRMSLSYSRLSSRSSLSRF